jgi:hypothetical protein
LPSAQWYGEAFTLLWHLHELCLGRWHEGEHAQAHSTCLIMAWANASFSNSWAAASGYRNYTVVKLAEVKEW